MSAAGGPVRVLVLVLDWNGARDTFECLASLRDLRFGGECRVMVIDNGSREPIGADLRREFAWVDHCRNEVNLGYAGGNNVGLRRALEEGFDYACILNNDVTVTADFLAELVGAARGGVRVAAAGAKVLAAEEPGRLYMSYGEVTYRQSLVRLRGWRKLDRPEAGGAEAPREVEWVPGCCLLMSVEALREVGLLDEDFFAYHEDVDWCARARKRGWRVLYVPRAVVYHRGNASLGGRKYISARAYLSARNSVLFARKHATPAQKAKLAAFILLSLPFQYLRRVPVGEGRGVTLKVEGWLDGLRGRPVPLEKLELR